MNIPTYLKPGLIGVVLGAVATLIIGFSSGGWYTTKSAERLADERSDVAVVHALVPVCVAQSKLDPNGAAKITEMTKMVTSYEQRDYVIKAGWATTSGEASANGAVATACADVLLKARAS